MSNRVDYFAAEETALSVPSGGCVVYVDGMLCPYLEVIEIVRASGPGYGLARLSYNPALWADGERVAVERIETVAAIGREVSIVALYNDGMGVTAIRSLKVFTAMRLVCVFTPALTGRETHDADGAYALPQIDCP